MSHVFAHGGDRVDQPMAIALGCWTIINWLAAIISICVAYVVGFSMSWRECSTLCIGTVFEGNQNLDVLQSPWKVEIDR